MTNRKWKHVPDDMTSITKCTLPLKFTCLIGKTCESADEQRDLEGVCSLKKSIKKKSTFSDKTGSAALVVVLTLPKLGDLNFPLGVNDTLRNLDCNLSTYPIRTLWTREESLLSASRLLIENKTKSFTTQITKP